MQSTDQSGNQLPKLVLILSIHVHDLKGGGEDDQVEALVAHLEEAVGKGKLDFGSFEHCGVKHMQKDDLPISTHT